MKRMTSLGWMCLTLVVTGFGQNFDQERMQRDIEVAENVLGTLLRQSTTRSKSTYFFSEVNGNYTKGYGVIFSVPFNEWYVDNMRVSVNGGVTISSNYRYDSSEGVVIVDTSKPVVADAKTDKEAAKLKAKAEASRDSARTALKAAYLDAMKTFLADYGDLIGQLGADEKIMVTNRPTGFSNYFRGYQTKRTLLSAEVTKADLTKARQGQLTRDQLLAKIKVTNTESADKIETDLELFSSILNRLYRSDLSKTYFTSGEIRYEQLIDYGAVYYMQVYSSNEQEGGRSIPTLGLSGLSEDERDKKVAALYPQFEKDIKESLVEYGKTIRSLKPSEVLVLNVKLTKCVGCGIPSTLELSVKVNFLQDYAAGKISKEAALANVNLTKGQPQ